jgi:hypothetical protein
VSTATSSASTPATPATPTPPTPAPAAKKKEWWQHGLTALRRLLAVVAIGVLVLVIARSYAYTNDDVKVCRDVAASDKGKVNVCGPVGLEDVPAIGVLLLVGVLLLLPDMSEVSIPGLVTLKRAVEEQSKQTKALSNEVATLALSMRQDTTVNVYPPKLDDAIKDVAARDKAIQEKGANAVAQETPEFGPEDTGVSAPSEERAVLEAEVIRLWNALEAAIPGLRPPYGRAKFEPDDLDWFTLYRNDVEAFRTFRNTVVHRPGNLTDDEVRKGLELGRRLLASYRGFINLVRRQRGG